MPKTKISEFDSVPANNTDIDGINIGEGMLPSDVNNSIRELMSQLKDFQAGTAGDSFNGPIGSTTAVAGSFTTIGATGDVSIADKIIHTGDTNTAIRFPAADTVAIETDGTERLRVTSTGAVQLANNLTFTGTGNRITGPMTGGTVASRLFFQNSVTNGNSRVRTMPNGTALISGFEAYNNSNPDNASFFDFGISSTEASITSGIVGTGTYQPIIMLTGGSERLRIDTSGNVGIGTSSPTAQLTVANDALISGLTVGKGTGTTLQSTAVGAAALSGSNSVGYNTAFGYFAAKDNTSGANLVAIGNQALQQNTTGVQNTGVGSFSMFSNTTGENNASLGQSSLYTNTTGSYNTAIGRASLFSNTTASYNVAVGYEAGYSATAGGYNTFIGTQAGYSFNGTGGGNNFVNTFVGYQAGYGVTTGDTNAIFGANKPGDWITTGSGNVVLGDITGVNIFNTNASNRLVCGHNNITNAYVKVAWTVTSDARDKTNIVEIPHGLEFVEQLKPVSFQFKKSREDNTPTGNKRYGFLAQDILALEGDEPVIIDNEEPEKLKYQGESLVPVLVKAIQEQQQIINDLKARIEVLESK